MADENTSPAQQSPELIFDPKPPKIVPLNGFPKDLFTALQPDYSDWKQQQPGETSFGAYLIHVLQQTALIQATNEALTSSLETANRVYEQNQSTIADLTRQVSTLHQTIERTQTEYQSQQARTSAGSKSREFALKVAARDTMEQAALLTSPGIFNRFKSMTLSQYEERFNQIYLENLSEQQ